MTYLVQLLVIIAISFSGPLFPADADELTKTSGEKQTADIELKASEIKGVLGDIVESFKAGSFKLNEMEIMGSVIDEPNFTYDKPWMDPEPFTEQQNLAYGLIRQSFNPLDRETFSRQVGFMTGTGDESGTAGESSTEFALK